MAVWRTVVTLASPVLGGIGTNTFHARTTTLTPDPEELTQLEQLSLDLAAMYVEIDSVFAGGTVVANDGEWVTVSEGSPRAVVGTPWTLTAPGADNALPPATALVIGWRTSLAARSGRGRTFLGPLAEGVNEGNGTPDEAARTQVHDAVDTWIATFSGGTDGAFVVWSSEDSLGRDIISGRTRNVFGSLTSRRD